MHENRDIDARERALCGQADAVFEILSRTGNLPAALSLSIEEIIERAWEIAYRRREHVPLETVVDLSAFRARNATHRPTAI